MGVCEAFVSLQTFVSRDRHSNGLPLALSPVERIVGYSTDQHGQLSMSICASLIIYLQTDWIHCYYN